MKNLAAVVVVLLCSISAFTQDQRAKLLKWDVEPYGRHGNVTRNAAIYYIQVGNTIYQVTRGTTRPESYLVVGKPVQYRIEKDRMFIPDEKGKEVKFSIIGASEIP